MSEVPLTQGRIAIIDDEDLNLVSKYIWHYADQGTGGKGYAKTNNKGKKPALLRMHRIILGLRGKEKVDHINRNTLDNRKSNLRIVTQSQNMMNAGIRKTNKSGFKGVHFAKREKKWLAMIWKDNKQIFLGYFKSDKEAANAYNEGAIKYHGEYALLNKI